MHPSSLAPYLVGLSALGALACPSPRPTPDPFGPESAYDYVPSALAGLARDATLARVGPIASVTIELGLPNTGGAPDEVVVSFGVPAHAVIGRLALEVEGRWMEAEVLSQKVAVGIYEGIVRPVRGPARDPAILTEVAPGRWVLKVFPVPAGGERRVRLTLHQLALQRPGVWIEERPALGTDPAARWFAVVPERVLEKVRPRSIVVALDTSLSMHGDIASAVAAIDALASVAPTTVVAADPLRGGLRRTPCGGAPCIAPAVGGASDLAALADAALSEAPPDAEVVLISDGLVNVGERDLAARIAAERAGRRVHVLALGPKPSPGLTAIAGEGGGGYGYRGDEVLHALGRELRRPIVGGSDVGELVTLNGVVLGRITGPAPQLLIDGQRVALGATPTPGFALQRITGLARLAGPPEHSLEVARRAGIPGGGVAALLALETDADYVARGIVRRKATELEILGGGAPQRYGLASWEPVVELPLPPVLPPPVPTIDLFPGALEDLLFEKNSAAVREKQMPLAEEVARLLERYPELVLIVLEGHASRDERDPVTLGLKRAEAARAALVAFGVSPNRVLTTSYGAEQPVAPDERRYNNRRVAFELFYKDAAVPAAKVLDGLARACPETPLAVRPQECFDLLGDTAVTTAHPSLVEGFARACAEAAPEVRLECFDVLLLVDTPWSHEARARRSESYLRQMEDPRQRIAAGRAGISLSARMLRFMGREDEAAWRESELIELGL